MFNNKIKKYYPQIAELYNKYKPTIEALQKEIDNAILDVMDDEDKKDDSISIPRFFSYMVWLQVYVTEPSDGATFGHDDGENQYYNLNVDGMPITEVVGFNT